MANTNWIKILGLAATVVSMGATLLSNWVDEKKMEERIDKCVDEKLAEMNENDEEEES